MDEVENNVAVMQEADTPETSPQVNDVSNEAQIDSKQDRNFKALRDKTKLAEKRAAELEAQLKLHQEALTQMFANQKNAVPAQQDELDTVPDEDYIPKGQVKKLLKKEREEMKKEAREEAQRLLNEEKKANFHKNLKDKFSDFDEVVTPETLDLLEQQDPELAQTIADLQDPYKMGLQTYKYIKSLKLSEQASGHKRSQEVDKKIEENKKTIQSPLAYDKRPIAQTFKMTEQLKNELYREMMGAAQLASSVRPIAG